MSTIIGMAAIFGIIGGGLMSIGGVIGALLELPALMRVASIFRRAPTSIGSLEAEADVTVRGRIERVVGAEITALTPGNELVWQHVIVRELVGRRMTEPVNQTTGTRFVVRDASGEVAIDATDAVGLSMPFIGGGPATPAVLAFAGNVFAWPKTPKSYVERGLRVEDEVTVSGTVEKGRSGLVVTRGRRPLHLVFGEQILSRTEEARAIGWAAAMVPAGGVLAGLSYLALTLATGH